jgi:hypothetical protein
MLHDYSLSVSGAPPWRIMAGGDDVLLQGVTDLRFCDVLTRLGFSPKPLLLEPGKGVFYSGMFVPTDLGVCLTPFIGRTFEKLGMSSRPVDSGWQNGVLRGLLAVYNHVPGVLEIIEHLLTLYPDVRNLTPKQNYITPKHLPHCKPVDTRAALNVFYPDYDQLIAVLYNEYVHNDTAFVSVGLGGFLERE